MRLVTGSRLYGTNRPDSDIDIYEIHDKIKSYHHVSPTLDITRWNLNLLMRVAGKGGHVALDILFSPRDWPEVDLLGDFRAAYYANPWEAYKYHTKKILEFQNQGTPKGDLHAQRLEENLESILTTGRYNPRWR